MRILSVAFPAAALAFALALALPGCGGSTGGTEGPTPIPVVNPDPKNPLSDVTLENEAQNASRIRAGTIPGKR